MKMDVLKPQLIHIGNRIYRKYSTENDGEEERMKHDDEEIDLVNPEENEYAGTYRDEVCDPFLDKELEKTDTGYRLQMIVANAYRSYIIGKGGDIKKRLENETRTQIRIPRVGQDGNIVIVGSDKKGLISAKTRIQLLVDSARSKQPFTHFLSLPMNTDLIKKRFLQFKTDVLDSCSGDRGLDATIFQNPNKLHFTVGIMPLMDDREIQQAVRLLQQRMDSVIKTLLESGPLVVNMRGLQYMNDDPSAVDVLYADVQLVDGSNRLQTMCNYLVDEFVGSGIMKRDYDRVKLHVTVMNTSMRVAPNGIAEKTDAKKRNFKDRESFDATNVLERYLDYDFGTCTIDAIHLSQRSCIGPTGYYASSAIISF